MTVITHVLVVANRTVDAEELHADLRGRAERGPIHVTLLAPVAFSERDAAQARMQEAIARLQAAGIAAQGMLGDADPIVAVQEAWDPGRYDEVVVATMAEGASRWLQIDLPHRVAKLCDCLVRHVEVRAPRPPATAAPRAPAQTHRGVLDTALSFLQSPPGSRRAG